MRHVKSLLQGTTAAAAAAVQQEWVLVHLRVTKNAISLRTTAPPSSRSWRMPNRKQAWGHSAAASSSNVTAHDARTLPQRSRAEQQARARVAYNWAGPGARTVRKVRWVAGLLLMSISLAATTSPRSTALYTRALHWVAMGGRNLLS